jgi:predicted transcriptional regulator
MMHEQKELDGLFYKIIDDYNSVNDKELTRLVQLINYKYTNNDIILSRLSTSELIKCSDYITRATYELTKRKGIVDTSSKHYILSNLCKARLGLESSSRKKIFIENNLFIENEINYRGTYIRFKFFNLDDQPVLLLKHIYGYGSITNWIENILGNIEEKFLADIGYNIIIDNISIYYKDIQINGMEAPYDKVILEEDFKNPTWEPIDSNWFEEVWTIVHEDSHIEQEPVFIEKNQPYTAYRKVKEIFNTGQKDIQIIDPYIDGTLFTLLNEINKNIKIKVITDKFQGDSELLYEKFKKERGNIEIQTFKGNHDRYVIIDRRSVYLFGSSINSLGNKSTTIVPIKNESVKKSIISYFADSWKEKTLQN